MVGGVIKEYLIKGTSKCSPKNKDIYPLLLSIGGSIGTLLSAWFDPCDDVILFGPCDDVTVFWPCQLHNVKGKDYEARGIIRFGKEEKENKEGKESAGNNN